METLIPVRLSNQGTELCTAGATGGIVMRDRAPSDCSSNAPRGSELGFRYVRFQADRMMRNGRECMQNIR